MFLYGKNAYEQPKTTKIFRLRRAHRRTYVFLIDRNVRMPHAHIQIDLHGMRADWQGSWAFCGRRSSLLPFANWFTKHARRLVCFESFCGRRNALLPFAKWFVKHARRLSCFKPFCERRNALLPFVKWFTTHARWLTCFESVCGRRNALLPFDKWFTNHAPRLVWEKSVNLVFLKCSKTFKNEVFSPPQAKKNWGLEVSL